MPSQVSYAKYHVTSLDAWTDPKFFLEQTGVLECKLKEDHPYYAQVQGQMAVTGARWCDLNVYTSKDKKQPFKCPSFESPYKKQHLNPLSYSFQN